jgi:hypothetical protein
LKLLLIAILTTTVLAQSPDKELAILELGGAASFNLKGSPSYGPDLAAEITPIENWLEIEAGVTPLYSRHSTEWDTDLLFKKPWDLSEKIEFMAGIGPEWVHTGASNAFALEAAADFMFWPTRGNRIGWYIEPAYDYTFNHAHEHSLGVTAGLLIAIGHR